MTTATGHTLARATLGGRTVLDAAVRKPKTAAADATVAQIRDLFQDDHVHAALIVADDGRLLSVVERPDLEPAPIATSPARRAGRLEGRVANPDADLEHTWREMRSQGRRRLALVDDAGLLLGLLCLKRTGLGFCTDDDVCARQGSEDRRVSVASHAIT